MYRYEVNARWDYGRSGRLDARNGAPIVRFSAPPEFNGEQEKWTPEHLLLSSIAGCYTATFAYFAQRVGYEFESVLVEVDGTVEKKDGKLQFTEIAIKPKLMIEVEALRERGENLLERAAEGCLITRSLKAHVRLHSEIMVASGVLVEVE